MSKNTLSDNDNQSSSSLSLTLSDNNSTQQASTPAQKRFIKLLDQIEKLTKKGEEYQQMIDLYTPLFINLLAEHEKNVNNCKFQVVLNVGSFLNKSKLTKLQYESGLHFLLLVRSNLLFLNEVPPNVTAVLAQFEDALNEYELQITPPSNLKPNNGEAEGAGQEEGKIPFPFSQADMDSFLKHMESMFGLDSEFNPNTTSGFNQTSAQSSKVSSKKQAKQEQEKLDAQSTLKTIFRQLASALHPDRETDEKEKERKSQLMIQVNAAYKNKDLSRLLQLQLEVAQIDVNLLEKTSDSQLKTFNKILSEQVEELKEENEDKCWEFIEQFDLDGNIVDRFTLKNLQRELKEAAISLDDLLNQFKVDVHLTSEFSMFKRWLSQNKFQTVEIS
jgi:hypothetical protein